PVSRTLLTGDHHGIAEKAEETIMATIRIRALIAVGCLLTCLACGSDSDATSESRSPSTAETAAGEPKSGDEAGNEADAEEDDGGLGDRTEADGTGPGTTT